MDFSNFHQRAMEKLHKDFDYEENEDITMKKGEDSLEGSEVGSDRPMTPTQSEFDTFQVLSNSNLVDFKKEKFSSKNLSPIPSFGKELEEETFEKPKVSKVEKVHIEEGREEEEEDNYNEDFFKNKNYQDDAKKMEPPYFKSENDNFLNEKFLKQDFFQDSFSKKGYEKLEVLSTNSEVEQEIEYEKQALLEELQGLQKQGSYSPIKNLTLKDSLEEIQFQYDRVQNDISTSQGVQMVISGIKMGSSILETLLKKFGFLSVDGFSQNLCKDPAKFNRPVTKLYKRYWRKGNMSPEAELSMIILGSLAWTIVQNKMQSPFSSSLEPKNLSAASLPESFSNPTKTTNGLNSYGNQENTTMYHPAPPKVNLQQFLEPPRLQAPQAPQALPPPSHQHTQQPVVIPRSIQGVSPPSSLAKKTESKKTITLGSRNSSMNSASTKKKSMLKL